MQDMLYQTISSRFRPKLALRGAAAAVASLALGSSLLAAPIVTVYPSLASNRNGSLTYDDYAANGDTSIENGGVTTGTQAAQYSVLANGTTMNYEEAVSTGFPSWEGVAAPNTPTYANEYGNKVVFGVDIKGNGQTISLSDLQETATSSDPSTALDPGGNALGYTDPAGGFTYGLGANNYGNDFIGIIYGTNGNPNTIISSGDPTQPVDEIIGSGDGAALAALSHDDYVNDPTDYGTDPFPADATDQERLDGTADISGIYSNFNFSSTYSIDGATGTAGVVFSVPEPTACASIFLGGAVLIRRPRRKRDGEQETI
jgi:hypothetical protein